VEDTEPTAFTDEHGLTLVEWAPYGVIASIILFTNPTSTVINNTISMVSAGNVIIFHPHPGQRNVPLMLCLCSTKLLWRQGGPENVISAIANPTLESAQTLMKHPGVRLLVVTGGRILVVDKVADELEEALVHNSRFRLTKRYMEEVTLLVIDEPGRPGKPGRPRKEWVGKDASLIAQAIGLNVPGSTRILFEEVERTLHRLDRTAFARYPGNAFQECGRSYGVCGGM